MLSKPHIDRLAYDPSGPATQVHYVSSEVPGLGVRVYPSGLKSFVLWYRTATGRKRMLTLGRYGVLTVREARQKALESLRAVGSGMDPIGTRRAERDAATVASFCDTFMEQHSSRRKKAPSEDRRRFDRYVIPAIGHHKLADVTRADIAKLHRRLGEKYPIEANRVISLAHTLFEKAREWGYLPEMAPNPARRVERFPERSRDRYVKPDELPHILAGIEAEPNEYVRALFRMYLLTGLRRSELLTLKWTHIDVAQRQLRLPTTKAGRPHVLPLSEPALAILKDLPRMVGNPYVFAASAAYGRPMINVSRPWLRIRARAWLATRPVEAAKLRREAETYATVRKGLSKHASERAQVVEARLLLLAHRAMEPDDVIRLHDLRRTVGSWLAMGGASLPLIGRVLNHSNASTTQIYARMSDEAPRAALEELAARMAQVGRGGRSA